MPLQPAPFFRRLAARLIDLVFALVLTFVIAVPVAVVYALTAGLLGEGLWLTLLGTFCYFLAYVGLEVYLLVRRDGQTLGKGLMSLRVVPAGAESEFRAPLMIGQAAVRILLIFLPFVLGSAAGSAPEDATLMTLSNLGLLSLVISLVLAAVPTRRRQTLHDLLGRTRVVRAPKRRIEWHQDVRMMVPGKVDMAKRA